MTAVGYKATSWGGPSNVRSRRIKRTIELIDAAHNDRLVGNVCFAIRKPPFAEADVNDCCGSEPVIPLQRRESAKISHSFEPLPMAVCGSESSH